MIPYLPTEYEEQKVLVAYLELQGLKFTAVPNSTYTKSWSQKTKNKESGLRAGFPDMIVLTKNNLLCIELKRTKKSTVSAEQSIWIEELNKIPNVIASVCYGADEAIKLVQKYL